MSRESIIPTRIDALLLRVAAERLDATQLADITAKIDAGIAALQNRSGISIPALRILTEEEPVADWTLEALGVPLGGGTLDQIETAESLPAIVIDLLQRNTQIFLGLQEVCDVLNELGSSYPEVVKEAVRSVPTPTIAETFRLLAGEQVQLRNLRGIVEAIADAGQRERNAVQIAQHVRVAIRRNVIAPLLVKGRLRVLMIDAKTEELLRATLVELSGIGLRLAIKPVEMNRLNHQLRKQVEAHGARAILTSQDLRWPLRSITGMDLFEVPVLSFNELDPSIPLDVVAQFDFQPTDPEQAVVLDDNLSSQPNTTFETPPQEAGAIGYHVNAEDHLDRLPPNDQNHLRDLPDHRRSYTDLREALIKLRELKAQRLGDDLHEAVEAFFDSLPERFEDALADAVWRDANLLRHLYLAHQKAEERGDPSVSRLEDMATARLGHLLDLYNNIAFMDDGLRLRDERRIPPQQRPNAKVEAAAAAAVQSALTARPAITTAQIRADIKADSEAVKLPPDDPYSDQALDYANRAARNRIAALLTWLKVNFGSPQLLGGAVAANVIASAAVSGGGTLLAASQSANALQLLEFVAANAPALQSYVAIAFSSYPHLPELIAHAKNLWQHLHVKV